MLLVAFLCVDLYMMHNISRKESRAFICYLLNNILVVPSAHFVPGPIGLKKRRKIHCYAVIQ